MLALVAEVADVGAPTSGVGVDVIDLEEPPTVTALDLTHIVPRQQRRELGAVRFAFGVRDRFDVDAVMHDEVEDRVRQIPAGGVEVDGADAGDLTHLARLDVAAEEWRNIDTEHEVGPDRGRVRRLVLRYAAAARAIASSPSAIYAASPSRRPSARALRKAWLVNWFQTDSISPAISGGTRR